MAERACPRAPTRSPATRETGSRDRSAACASERPEGRTRGPEIAVRQPAVDPLGHGPDDLELNSPRRLRCRNSSSCSPVTSPSACGSDRRRPQRPVPRSVRRRHASRSRHAPDARRVEAVAGSEVRSMPPTKAPGRRHDHLLVVAMERPLVRIERALDSRVGRELVSTSARRPVRTEERQRRPAQAEHRTSTRSASPARSSRSTIASPFRTRANPGREVPARDMDMRSGRPPRRRRSRATFVRAVDKYLDRVPGHGGVCRAPNRAARCRRRPRYPTDPTKNSPPPGGGCRSVLAYLPAKPALDRYGQSFASS